MRHSTYVILNRADVYDIEDPRETHLRNATILLLGKMGAERTIAHGDATWFDSATGRERHLCQDPGSRNACRVVWPEWVTEEVVNHAYDLSYVAWQAQVAINRRGLVRK